MEKINNEKADVLKRINPLFLKGIAHRGLHNDKYTENGMLAFKNAIDNNVSFELDVHLTKDNDLIVCHDSELKRTTGKEGIIEDLTVKEIKDNYKLLDGSEIPTLKEVMELNDEKVPMVIELKVYRKNYKELSKRLIEELENVKDKKNYMLISFDPRGLAPMKKTGIVRQLLVWKDKEWTYCFRHLFESLDLDYRMIEEKRVQKYYKNHIVNVWTIENVEQLKTVSKFIDTVTFQYIDPKEVEEILKK